MDKKDKVFKPFVLFNNTEKLSESNANSRKEAIESHWLKVERFLEHNTRIWMNEGAYFYDTLSKANTTDEHMDCISVANKGINYYTNSAFSYLAPTSSSIDNRQEDQSIIDALEPGTRTETPPPLYFIGTNRESIIPDHPIREESNSISREQFESRQSKPISTKFITEPQFYHVHKPHLYRKKRRGNLPKEVTEFLKRWLILHKRHPYPTEREKQELADETGLGVNQISNWFINARRRILQPLLESESQQARQMPEASHSTTSRSSSYFINYPSERSRSSSIDTYMIEQEATRQSDGKHTDSDPFANRYH
ncbi:Putative Homeobox protein PKNOX2 [Rhizopus microsporus]|nr:Putative Homeobox protein PKNOX2 [Rhizopus microsporus]